MKFIFSPRLQGSCSKCHAPLTGGGYLGLEDNGQATGMFCKECRQNSVAAEVGKSVAITLKKIEGSFVQFILRQELYQVLACKNVVLPGDIITGDELAKFVSNPNISVTIKY